MTRQLSLLVCLSLGCPSVTAPPVTLTDGGVVIGAGGGSAAGGGAGGGGGVTLSLPMKPPVINLALLVALSTSTNKFLAETANARLEVDPTARDPLTALGECADAVSYCYAPPLLGITECLASVRHCETETPWLETLPCCPKACVTAFSAELQAGQSEMQALETVFFREPDCFPGVRAALEAK